MRLDQVPADEIATTVSNYEEQMRGWLARAAQANTAGKMVTAYARLLKHVETFKYVPMLPFDEAAAEEFERLRRARVRIGSMDLKIAAIALTTGATLLKRNLSAFAKVPDLLTEDWSV